MAAPGDGRAPVAVARCTPSHRTLMFLCWKCRKCALDLSDESSLADGGEPLAIAKNRHGRVSDNQARYGGAKTGIREVPEPVPKITGRIHCARSRHSGELGKSRPLDVGAHA